MFKNYLKIAWRNIIRNKAFSSINILGLAIGIAASLLILQYVAFELSYDKFHAQGNRIFRVQQDRYNDGKLSTQWAAGAYAVGNHAKLAFPEVEEYVKMVRSGPLMVDYNNNNIKVEKVYYTGSSFFSVFTYPLLAGDKKTVLDAPKTVAISASLAQRLFGKEEALGKTIRLNQEVAFKVTGVFRDISVNSHLKADMLLPYARYLDIVKPGDPETAWDWDGCLTYLLLRPGADARAVEKKFPALVQKFTGDYFSKLNAQVIYHLQPLKDIHLYSHYMEEAEANGDGNTVYLLLGIAFFIIVIAWINYINLATARAINRAVEVGIRKTVGSMKSQLMKQFLLEAALLNAIAVGLALLIVLAATPFFNELTGLQLSFSSLNNYAFWLTLLGLFLAGSFLSGLYPAFILAAFKPVVVLKGKGIASRQGSALRKSLVVCQFAASLFLLIGTLTVYRQIQFMRTQKLGMNINQTLVVSTPIVVKNDSSFLHYTKAFKQELLRDPSIRIIAASSIVPGRTSGWNAGAIRIKGQDIAVGKQYRIIDIDDDFVPAYELKLLAGRNFSDKFGMDSNAVIFNRVAARQLGFDNPEDAVGKVIDFWGTMCTITGVVDNFHQQTLREAYDALILKRQPGQRGYFSIKIDANQAQRAIAVVQRNWNTFFPGNPLEYFFLDQHFNDQYEADRRFGRVFGLFTTLAILVACLGLFGLASFTTVQRTKEIGIRKVLGASVMEIVTLLYKEFAMLIGIAFIVATPLAWYASARWLENYAFHTSLYWWLFVLPFSLILLIAFATVSFQSIKAALTNPVTSLRTE
ncbi:FtsX-like permease family protein [Chitinophaga agrisoli]|uniref:FtsX-like permease family protein n=1 Tax=Chitinophaga agrisoli TaxID=2607653 RepID=A0A5B2VSX3_9BACT|nr:ABC transporter permease [Chitinophaga agrisoli]KAA2242903.1 FtsX-like permease family protein [Chitinophaga agrisoli]